MTGRRFQRRARTRRATARREPAIALTGLPVLAPAVNSPGVPTSAGYTLLLLVHVAAAVVGFGSLLLTGVFAARAIKGPSGSGAQSVRRYFRPGVNWAGRTLYLVPVFGFALLGDSKGVFDSSDGFVVAGLGLWLTAAVVAEAVVWPAERRIQGVVSDEDAWRTGEAETEAKAFLRDCRRVLFASSLLGAVFVIAVVVMVGKP